MKPVLRGENLRLARNDHQTIHGRRRVRARPPVGGDSGSHRWRWLVIGRALLTLGVIVMVAAFSTQWWWVAAGTVLVAAGLGVVLLGLRARATRKKRGIG